MAVKIVNISDSAELGVPLKYEERLYNALFFLIVNVVATKIFHI